MQGKRALDFDSLRDSGLNLAQGFIFFLSTILPTGCQNCSKFTWKDQEVGSGLYIHGSSKNVGSFVIRVPWEAKKRFLTHANLITDAMLQGFELPDIWPCYSTT